MIAVPIPSGVTTSTVTSVLFSVTGKPAGFTKEKTYNSLSVNTIVQGGLMISPPAKVTEVLPRSKTFPSSSLLINMMRGRNNTCDLKADWGIILNANNNESFKIAFSALVDGLDVERTEAAIDVDGEIIPKGSFLIESSDELSDLLNGSKVPPKYITTKEEISSKPIDLPRIGLVETYFHDMDAGWTRYIFDTYNLPYKVIRPGEFEDLNVAKNFDVVIFPSSRKSVLMNGKYKSGDDYYVTDYPPKYTKGMGKKGFQNVLSFIEDGGIILSWGNSTELFMGSLKIEKSKNESEEFQLPVKDVSKSLSKNGLYIPGSFTKMLLTKDHPITLGMEDEIGVFYRGRPVFETSIPSLDLDRRVIGKFPEDEILLSGYGENEKLIGNKTGLVWLKKGKGQLVLFAFNPQFRASTNVSYKLLFNSILLQNL